RIEGFLEIGDTRKHRRNLLEMQFGRVCKQSRHRGLAGAGRTPENQRSERARLQHTSQRAVGTQDVILAHDIGKLAWTQPGGKRVRRILLQPRGGEQGCALARSLRAHPLKVTLICWPPRTSTMRHSRLCSCVTLSRSLVLVILWLLTAMMMSPFWKPKLAATEPSSTPTTTTPFVSSSRCSSSATTGEMLATVAPWNGERDANLISSRLILGAASSGTVSLIMWPARSTVSCDVPPSGCVAKR